MLKNLNLAYFNSNSVRALVLLFAASAIFLSLSARGAQTNAKLDSTHWPTLLVLGDSLSAAFGIEQSQGWVSLLAKKLNHNQYRMKVVNASISGETTQGGLQRLPALIKKHSPSLVVVELGGNDGLRGLKLSMIKNNLQHIIEIIKASNANVLLTGIRLPPNYGQVYTQKFYEIYSDLAKQEEIPLVPFLMDGVATRKTLMQADGIHPTENAQSILLNNVWEKLQPMLKDYRVNTTGS